MKKRQIRAILERAADDRRIDDDVEAEAEEIRSAGVKMCEMGSGIRWAVAALGRVCYNIEFESDVLSGSPSVYIPDNAETSALTADVDEVYAAYNDMLDSIREFLSTVPREM